MRCNACWRELEGQATSTTCGHLLCNEDASKILSNDAACPICDQVLSKSLMKPVDINPNEEWINMFMAGISPQILMKSAERSVMFYIGQKELEMQFKMNRIVAQCRQKCETMQEKFTEKMEQLHTAYQKLGKRCQMMEQEIQNLSKDKEELQEKFSEKSRQKRKLDEMYDELRTEYESVKRSAIQPANNNSFSRGDSDLFACPAGMMDNRDPIRKGSREDIWPAIPKWQKRSNSLPLDISASPSAKHSGNPVDNIGRQTFVRGGSVGGGGGSFSGGSFGGGGGGVGNSRMALRNPIMSQLKRPQLSPSRSQLFPGFAEQALSHLNGTELGGQNICLLWGPSPSSKQGQSEQPQYGGGAGGRGGPQQVTKSFEV